MADIFLSYASEDSDIARSLAEALTAEGWDVWWDRRIPAGGVFDDTIEAQLGNAACVVVLWSDNAVRSRWVKEEAEEGLDRGVLVPVLVSDVRPPMGYRRIQTASLVGWGGAVETEAFQRLVSDIRRIVPPRGSPVEKLGEGPAPAAPEPVSDVAPGLASERPEFEDRLEPSSPDPDLVWMFCRHHAWRLWVRGREHSLEVKLTDNRGAEVVLDGVSLAVREETPRRALEPWEVTPAAKVFGLNEEGVLDTSSGRLFRVDHHLLRLDRLVLDMPPLSVLVDREQPLREKTAKRRIVLNKENSELVEILVGTSPTSELHGSARLFLGMRVVVNGQIVFDEGQWPTAFAVQLASRYALFF